MAHPYRDPGRFVLQPEVPFRRASKRRGWLVVSLAAHMLAVLLVMQCVEVEQLENHAVSEVRAQVELRQPRPWQAPLVPHHHRFTCRLQFECPHRDREEEAASTVKPVRRPSSPALVPPQVLAALQLSGERNVVPIERVQRTMRRDGVDRLQAAVKLCVGADGAVSSIIPVLRTRYPDHDAAIDAAIRGWQFRPYERDGIAVPVCSTVTFVYRLP